MEKNIIILIVVLFIITNCVNFGLFFNNRKNIEKMANTDDDKITEEINRIYKADIQSIRNLADISKKLQDKGVTLPGDLTVEGKFNYLPTGSIMAFNKAVAPSGWAVCDGTKGTPDLRGRFIRMHSGTLGTKNASINVSYDKTIAGNSRTDIRSHILKHKFGEIAGTDHHMLIKNEMPAHNHGQAGEHTHKIGTVQDDWNGSGGTGPSFGGDNGRFDYYNRAKISKSGNHTHATEGSSWGHNNQPPYYVLTYIMKL